MTERTYAFDTARRSFVGLFWCVVAALCVDALYYALKHIGLEQPFVLKMSLPFTGGMIVLGILACVCITRIEALFENPMWHRRCRAARRAAIVSLLGFVGIIGGGFLLQLDPEFNALGITCILLSWLAHIVGGFALILRSCQWGIMIGRMFNRESMRMGARHVLACGVITLVGCLLLLLVSVVRGPADLYSEGEIVLFSAIPLVAVFGAYTLVRYLILLRDIEGGLVRLGTPEARYPSSAGDDATSRTASATGPER